MSNLLSIVILNWNRKIYSVPTIEGVLKKTTVPHELIIVDNNSSEPGLVEYLDAVKGNKHTVEKKLIRNPYNMGVAGGRNEGLKEARGDVITVIDDDLVVPDSWDRLLIQAVNTPKVGIVGINVEPINYPAQIINGVKLRPKTVGNIGGICQCFSRKIFNIIGYFETFGGQYYANEDAINAVKLKKLGLLGVYIVPRGIHLDKDLDKEYRKAKTKAHTKRSPELCAFAKRKLEIERGASIYTPYRKFVPPSAESGLTIYDDDMILKERKK